MTREDRLKSCGICENRGFNPKHGIVCDLTKEIATFNKTCPDFKEDASEKELQVQTENSKTDQKTKEINKARIALFIIGGLYILIGIYEGFFLWKGSI